MIVSEVVGVVEVVGGVSSAPSGGNSSEFKWWGGERDGDK